jgi:hypothetical protein
VRTAYEGARPERAPSSGAAIAKWSGRLGERQDGRKHFDVLLGCERRYSRRVHRGDRIVCDAKHRLDVPPPGTLGELLGDHTKMGRVGECEQFVRRPPANPLTWTGLRLTPASEPFSERRRARDPRLPTRAMCPAHVNIPPVAERLNQRIRR